LPYVGLTDDNKMPQFLSLGPKTFQGAALRPVRGGSPSTPVRETPVGAALRALLRLSSLSLCHHLNLKA